MRRFYLVAHDPDPELSSVIEYDIGDFDDTPLLTGNPLKEPVPADVCLLLDDGKIATDYVNNPLSWRLFSSAGKDVFQPFLQPCDSFLQLELVSALSGGRRSGFWVGSFCARIDCMDAERSVYRKRPDGVISSISKLVVRENTVPRDVHVFLVEKFPFYMVIDTDVQEAIDEAGLIGITTIACEVT